MAEPTQWVHQATHYVNTFLTHPRRIHFRDWISAIKALAEGNLTVAIWIQRYTPSCCLSWTKLCSLSAGKLQLKVTHKWVAKSQILGVLMFAPHLYQSSIKTTRPLCLWRLVISATRTFCKQGSVATEPNFRESRRRNPCGNMV